MAAPAKRTLLEVIFAPLGRLGFILCLPILALCGWGAFMMVLGTALQYPGHVPDDIWMTYLAWSLLFFIPAILAPAKRLRSIGMSLAPALGLSAFIMLLILLGGLGLPGMGVCTIWMLALALIPPHKVTESRDGASPPAVE